MSYENPSRAPVDASQTTHFGFQTVSVAEKAGKVADVFTSVADRYDLMNDLMSFGIHRLWKRLALTLANIRAGEQVLDLAGGTGDLAANHIVRVGPAGSVILADINASMLARGRARLEDRGLLGNVRYVQADAEKLPFADNQLDCITIGFGLRNVTNIDAALASMTRVLKPGGRVLILEFSKPVLPFLQSAYDAYSFHVLPKLGEWVAKDAPSYQYLVESIRQHPDQETLMQKMKDAGLTCCQYHNLTGGIVAIHRGVKC